ncbi:CHAT domain-containing protein [soil metagenome]
MRGQQPTPNPVIELLANQLLSAKTDAVRENLLNENRNLLTAELAANLLQKGGQPMSRNEFRDAERAFSLSLKVSETANNRAGVAAALRNLGGVNGIQGKFDKALEYFQKAAIVYETLADEKGLATALRGIGNVESTFGNYEKGIDAFRRSLALFEKTGDKAGQSSINSSLNIVYQNIGDFERALEHGNRALALARDIGNKNSIGAALSNLANLMNSRGDYRSALQYNEEALQIFEQQGQAERIALTLNNIGNTYLQQNDFSVAENYFRRGLELREKIGDKDGIARSNLRLGELMILQGNYAAALQFLKRGVELRETEAKDPASLASALSRLGNVYFKQNDLPKAGDYYRRALSIAESVGEKETIAVILIASARFHLANGEREAAAAEINRVVEIASALGLREILWEAQTLAGEIALAANDKIRARQSFEAAIKTIEESRFLIAGGERERQQFFESKVKPYHALVELFVGDKKYEEAFAFAERAKARVLLDVLQTGRAQPSKAMTAPEQAQETKLRNAIYAANNQLQIEAAREKPDAAQIADLQKKLGQTRTAFDSFTTLLYVAHPELKIQRGETSIADSAELNKLFPNSNAVLLEYVVTENRAFVFVFTSDKTKPKPEVFPIEIKRKDLSKMIENFRDKIAKRDLRFAGDAKKLYNLLLAPVAKQIENRSRLIISADGALWELPFQALVDKQNKYVVETAAVSYAPSLSVLTEITRKENKQFTELTLLAFGNPSHTAKIISNEKNARPVLLSETVADLPEAQKQVEELSKLYGANRSLVFTGAKATETEFKQQAGKYTILHLATHGVLDDASPLYSYILLASDATKDAEDGRLEAWELMRMNLSANLVVLSACETGRGRIGQGEGLIGLSWAFFVAGSPTIVASLWKVESASTTALMLGFYRLIQSKAKPNNKAEALRQSSLKLLKTEKYAHPFYWAGFVVIGNSK